MLLTSSQSSQKSSLKMFKMFSLLKSESSNERRSLGQKVFKDKKNMHSSQISFLWFIQNRNMSQDKVVEQEENDKKESRKTQK